ncbi:MAG: hypothetical protein WBI41_05830 [Azovibrio sp.]|uniref:hypothetical protein n=1 Tax=Azovibrio sp. TaxID=1872673 RepID=UPI003C7324A7
MLLIDYIRDNTANAASFAAVRGFMEDVRWTNHGGQYHLRQFGYANIKQHRGETNLPKGGVFFTIERIFDEYLDVRVLSTNPATNGRVFRVSKRLSIRINPAELWCMAHDVDNIQVRFRDLLLRFCAEPRWLNQYQLRANPGSRVSNLRRAAENDPRNSYRTVKWLNAYGRRLEFWTTIRAEMADLGRRNAERMRRVSQLKDRLAADAASVTATDVRTLVNALGHEHNTVSNRWRCASDSERAFIMKLRADLTVFPGLVTATSCGHWDWEHNIQPIPGEQGTYCHTCRDGIIQNSGPIIQAIDESGNMVDWLRGRACTWSDGTKRTYKEPPIIGQYHSSSSKLATPLPHITGDKVHASELKVGFELEFVTNRGATAKDANYYARLMKARMEEVTQPILGTQPYALFEYDASVDWEMVTGYGPLDIHRAAVIAILGGKPFGNEVHSHNGGKCGLHVHLDKPSSLMHAVRLQSFYNSPMNEKLVRAVARRYSGDGYARVKGEKGNMIQAAKSAKSLRGSYGYQGRAEVLLRAINRLSSDRYELVNFTPTKTVEIRAFRGSMITETVIACLEFAYMSWYFARDTQADELTTQNFLKFISLPEWRHQTKYLRGYLKARGFKVWVPSGKKTLSTQEA